MKLKIVFIVALLASVAIEAYGQAPTIQWSKKFGGAYDDFCKSVTTTFDGNYVALGSSESIGGDITDHRGPAGRADFWLIKIDANGNLIWRHSLGGTFQDEGSSVQETIDHGFIITGTVESNNVDVTNLHGANGVPAGAYDIWVVKTDSLGQIEWQKCYGSTVGDYGVQIRQTSDTGFIIMGNTYGLDGDITNNHGDTDWWVAKLNSSGVIQWSTCLGGFWSENALAFTIMDDGNFLFTGGLGSSDGNVHCSNINAGVWVVKLDTAGNILWQNCYGGSGDEQGFDILNSHDGGFYLAATTNSNDGDVTGLIGYYDFWIVRCDSLGGIIWEKCFGGIFWDQIESITNTFDGGVIACGYSDSASFGMPDMKNVFVVKIDSSGNEEWEKYFGGSRDDQAYSIIQTPDSSYLIAGNSNSTDGDITNYKGAQDFWIFKLNPPSVGVKELETKFYDLIGKINNQNLLIQLNSKTAETVSIALTDIQGRILFSTKVTSASGVNEFQFPVNVSQGIYLLRMQSKSGLLTQKIY